ncbi:hypothetical protein [Pseudobacteriovorax antillogorgiicola]|uniref:Uncharacterized protein n=1 Tax=Pseudobacteriovorax antillogorgiicola TaxID=1513793 RepID=A0A1Y6CL60_9BACT|nr:hypothetical protein [Pseudobacteriovorax antillogorgiicola]TCS47899.1 hypothetical protein EDD56_11910 [Pseudobacteriovorax antillogorgiicola]SMF57779.1 hypothetical protein SAMN06296036_11911 [Pseudobacteriovorax antillogorgiicola]
MKKILLTSIASISICFISCGSHETNDSNDTSNPDYGFLIENEGIDSSLAKNFTVTKNEPFKITIVYHSNRKLRMQVWSVEEQKMLDTIPRTNGQRINKSNILTFEAREKEMNFIVSGFSKEECDECEWEQIPVSFNKDIRTYSITSPHPKTDGPSADISLTVTCLTENMDSCLFR